MLCGPMDEWMEATSRSSVCFVCVLRVKLSTNALVPIFCLHRIHVFVVLKNYVTVSSPLSDGFVQHDWSYK